MKKILFTLVSLSLLLSATQVEVKSRALDKENVVDVIDINTTREGIDYHQTFINIRLKNSNKCKINITE